MKYIKCMGLLVALMFSFSSVASNVVNLNSTLSASHVLSLDAGSYTAQVTAGAWNAWGQNKVEGCNAGGFDCDKGFLNQFSVSSDDIGTQLVGAGGLAAYETAALALNNATTFWFTLNATQNVSFFIDDTNYTDNFGTIQVSVSAVPEASTYALMLSGLGMVAFMIRRRKLNL